MLFRRYYRFVLLNVIDILLVFLSGLATVGVIEIFGAEFEVLHGGLLVLDFGILSVLICLTSIVGKTNSVMWRFANETDYMRLLIATLLDTAVALAFLPVGHVVQTGAYFYFTAFVLSGMAVLVSRILYKIWRQVRRTRRAKAGKKTCRHLLIIGAGTVASDMIIDLKGSNHTNLVPVALIDDDPQKMHRYIHGVRVVGTSDQIVPICQKYDIDEIYIAIPSASNATRAILLGKCAEVGCPVKIVPHFSETTPDKNRRYLATVRDITPEELLGREPIQVANEKVLNFVGGKRVMVTGGGGSIGSEICRQIAKHNPERLVIVDIYENNAYGIQQELKALYGDTLNMEVYIASVRDFDKINVLMAKEKPQLIFHAAAHKHVPLMEVSPDEAIKNNVFGTYNTARAANENGVERFILISTDKAVNPTNVMGASKRMCEMVIQYFNSVSKGTRYAAVRFGNVLGSNGSVIPLFKKQIAERRDVTVTDPRIIRYFMTIPEASQLVLTAGAMARGGEIFILDMGEPVKIDDLARKMISLSGLVLGRDINIKYVGLRPGEKLYEELLIEEEGIQRTLNKKIFISGIKPVPFEVLTEGLQRLKELVSKPPVDEDILVEEIKVLVPTFNHQKNEKVKDENKDKSDNK